ncbi:MAG: GPN-loop GTPase 2 [Piccolia ochrophora]|nr:MAG: GPN-loop GTPase 2 [Piccolia ochrophora]
MPFAQLVIGPPGSGKSTYCDGMQQFMTAINRKCSVVNLDPANDRTSYPCALDVRDLVTLDDIMNDEDLGPNGGVLYALEELENNVEWLEQGLEKLGALRLVVLHLTDSYSLTLPSLYISTLLLSLRAMLQMDLPHINVLTKIDNLSTYAPLQFNLDYYTEVQDLNYLIPHLAAESPLLSNPKFEGLNKAIIELVEDFGLVGYETLAVEDKKSMMKLLHTIDRAGGYAFGGVEGANETVWQVAVREGATTMDIRDVQERWLDAKDEYDEAELKQLEEESKSRAPSSGITTVRKP